MAEEYCMGVGARMSNESGGIVRKTIGDKARKRVGRKIFEENGMKGGDDMDGETYTVESIGQLDCDTERAWEKVCFYEHIVVRPSLLLRLILPVPRQTTGCYGKVGDVSRCIYSDGGYLTKKISGIAEGKSIEFDIIEQSIRYHRGVKLKGGWIEILADDDGKSRVRMVTRYGCRYRPRFLARLAIDMVVKAMHSVVIRDMQYCLADASLEVQQSRAA